ADRVAGRERTTIVTAYDGAYMEGEAKEAFAAIPGVGGKGRVNPVPMLVSDNSRRRSRRTTKASFSMQPTFEPLAVLGWNVIPVPQGHDLQAVFLAVEKAVKLAQSNLKQPVALWIKTIKGYGVKATEENAAGGHGFPLANGEKIVEFVNEICGGQTPPDLAEWAKSLRLDWEKKEAAKKAKAASAPAPAPGVKKDKVQAGLAKAAIAAAKEGLPVFSISADVQGSTGI